MRIALLAAVVAVALPTAVSAQAVDQSLGAYKPVSGVSGKKGGTTTSAGS